METQKKRVPFTFDLGEKWERAARAVLLGAAVFSMLSMVPFLVERFGVSFLPDPVIFAATNTLHSVLAVGMATALFVALFIHPPKGRFFGVLRLTAPAIYAVIFYVGLTSAVPMVWTTVAGAPTVKVVTVSSPEGMPTARCRPAVQLRDLPFLFNRLCNVPPALLMTLSPGDKVMLIGRGTRLGVFYEEALLLPRGEDV
ncbi:hypothetical protein [Mesobacterium hydrothermale]|uniref:hypothetical protein n=1 Tax=Mesobacterium hydrothermale TaxID=3111907 RepID=UPI002DB88AA1|nr:hypothetical protein [Mesobacterium sp. TK19101]